jgi:hypothetical protein
MFYTLCLGRRERRESEPIKTWTQVVENVKTTLQELVTLPSAK